MSAAAAMDALDADLIRAAVPADEALDVAVLVEVDSTNAALWRAAPSATPHALLAEQQTAGRGRRGRHWISAAGDSLCLSLRWQGTPPLAAMGPLPLVAGMACAEALRYLGAAVQVKWPNDLVCAAGKLGGILVEARSHVAGSDAVIGIGLNLRVPLALASALDTQAQQPAALAGLLPKLPSRNALAAALLAQLLRRLRQFEQSGWPPLQAAWNAVDALAGQRVRVHDAAGERSGQVLGLATDGALRVRFADGEATLHSGEVSVRA